VCRRDLHRASAEGHVDENRVGDDGEGSRQERVLDTLAVQVLHNKSRVAHMASQASSGGGDHETHE
jgi:hypothetical protein